MKKYVKNKNIASQKVDKKEVVLLHPKAEKFFSLNATAAFIWDMLEQPHTEEELIAAMFCRYSGPKDLMERDLKNVIKILTAFSLIYATDDKPRR